MINGSTSPRLNCCGSLWKLLSLAVRRVAIPVLTQWLRAACAVPCWLQVKKGELPETSPKLDVVENKSDTQ
jgi:hypothetical protein